MRVFGLVVLLALASVVLANEEAVMTMNSKNFQKAIKGNEYVLVEFYAPWCGHCKTLAPEYEKAAQALAAEGSGIVLGKVDATQNEDLASEYKVQGYPTLKFFKNGEVSDYGGGRTGPEIVNWLKKKTGAAAKPLATAAEVKEFVAANNEKAVVGFFNKKNAAHKLFLSVAAAQDAFVFGEVLDGSIGKAFGAPEAPAVVFFRPESLGEDVVYVGGADRDFDDKELTQFLKRNSLPLVGVVGPETFNLYFESGLPLFLAFLDPAEEATNAPILAALEPLALAHKGVENFGWTDGVQFAEQAKRFGASGGTPDIAYLNFARGQNLGFNGEAPMTVASMTEWVDSVLKGTTKWQPKSEPVPEQSGPVFVAVGSNIEEVVYQDKDVFIEFYAPWCGHCKSLAPVWKELAQKVAGVSSVVIANCNADDNDVQHIHTISGFPTLVLFPKGATKGITYQGARDVESMLLWLKDNVATPFTLEAGKEEL